MFGVCFLQLANICDDGDADNSGGLLSRLPRGRTIGAILIPIVLVSAGVFYLSRREGSISFQ